MSNRYDAILDDILPQLLEGHTASVEITEGWKLTICYEKMKLPWPWSVLAELCDVHLGNRYIAEDIFLRGILLERKMSG